MKKYLISIEADNSPRLQNFFSQSNFQPYKDDFKKIGIKGKELTVKEYFDLAVATQKQPLSPGELGCTLSHMQALRDFITSNEKYALVLEDDAIQIMDIDLNQFKLEVVNLNLQNCFFMSLGGIQLKVNDRIYGKIQPKKIYNKNILKLHPYSIADLSYTYAYVVDKEMAKVLLDYHHKPHVCDHWDELYHFYPKINFYATFLFDHPEIIFHTHSTSSIELERKLLSEKSKVERNIFEKFNRSFKKRWLKLFYEQYREF
ncbi:glycosyltransferase family 25 protein [Acinetobacter baumannii]|uniref:glycosyltransferase family 25 protein n=1 Tax=Acinetobacter baumannii TaxID=470 RepID=UPI0037DE7EF3